MDAKERAASIITQVQQECLWAVIPKLLSERFTTALLEAERAALERAATAAEQQPATATPGIWSSIQEMHANEIAASIRSLIPSTTGNENEKRG